MIYLGEKKVGSIYLGEKKLSKIYFGEMTFTSYGAIMDFYSDEFLKKCGSMIKLPKATR